MSDKPEDERSVFPQPQFHCDDCYRPKWQEFDACQCGCKESREGKKSSPEKELSRLLESVRKLVGEWRNTASASAELHAGLYLAANELEGLLVAAHPECGEGKQ